MTDISMPLRKAICEPKLRECVMPSDARVRSRRSPECGRRNRRAAVVDENDLVIDIQLLKRVGQSPMHDRYRLLVHVAGDNRGHAAASRTFGVALGHGRKIERLRRCESSRRFASGRSARSVFAVQPMQPLGFAGRRIPIRQVPDAAGHMRQNSVPFEREHVARQSSASSRSSSCDRCRC